VSKLYVNGVMEAEGSGISASLFVGPLNFGSWQDGSRYFPGIMDDIRIYDGALTEEEIPVVMLGNATPELADNPTPEHEVVDVPRDTVLAWEAGEFAVAHDVYLGTVFDDVNDAGRANPTGVLLSEGQAQATYQAPAVFEYGQTYYWRIDEVNAAPDSTIFKGETWSFTIEPLACPLANVTATSNAISEDGAGPENTIDGSGLNELDQHSIGSTDMFLGKPSGDEPVYIHYEFDGVYKLHEMLVWNYNVAFELLLGFGFKDTTVEYSEDGEAWTVVGDVTFNQAAANETYTANTTVDFDGVAAKYVRLTVNSSYDIGMLPEPQYGLSEVRFMYIPAQAREPQPDDGQADVLVTTDLSWRAGREAVSHEVYWGTDPNALTLADTTTETCCTPGTLDLATTYYWKVDEVNDVDAVNVWEGTVWSFTTQEFIVVDDFESYNDEDNLIYETWADGWVNETGSTVGYLQAPFAEQTIVHGGSQSMPLFYDNTDFATSEADLELSQDWTANGVKSLSLYFQGDLDNSGGQLYVKVNGTKVAYDGPAVNIVRPSWQLWNIDLSAVGNVSNVSKLTIGVEGAGANGVVYIDDIRLYPEVLEYLSPDITGAGDTVKGVPDDGDWPDDETPDMAIDDNSATKFLHRKGGAMATGFQVEPMLGATVVTKVTFTTANDSPSRDPISFELSGSNASIDGPYTVIAAGDIVDFAGATEWPRFTKNETPIEFENAVAYTYYQIVFPTLRGEAEALMQIAEVELIGTIAP